MTVDRSAFEHMRIQAVELEQRNRFLEAENRRLRRMRSQVREAMRESNQGTKEYAEDGCFAAQPGDCPNTAGPRVERGDGEDMPGR